MKRFYQEYLPELAAFGPLFIVVGTVFDLRNMLAFSIAVIGALMTSLSLLTITRELLRLRSTAATEEQSPGSVEQAA